MPGVALRLAGIAAGVASIFSDEIEFTQISRGIAETGMPSRLRRAEWLRLALHLPRRSGLVARPDRRVGGGEADRRPGDDGGDLPRLGLARFVVSRPWAIAAAIGAVAAPPLAYAPYLLEEPLAYPFSTTALWAITAAIARPNRWRLALAGALCLVAPFVRGELAVLLAVYGAALFVLLWRTDRFTRWRCGLERR